MIMVDELSCERVEEVVSDLIANDEFQSVFNRGGVIAASNKCLERTRHEWASYVRGVGELLKQLLVANMKTHTTLAVVFLILACCSCSKSPETLVRGGYDEKEMDAAIARARNEVDSFIAEMSKGNGTDFAV